MTVQDLRARILAADDRPMAPVDCPEWDATIHVRMMSAGERDAWARLFERDNQDKGEKIAGLPDNCAAHLVALTACDETGARIFTGEDVEALTGKNGTVVERIARASMKHNGLLQGSIGESEKNF